MDGKKRKSPVLEHRLFWLVLAAVVILPLAWLVSSEMSFISLESWAIQKIGFVKEGSQVIMDIKDVEGVKLLRLHFAEDTKDEMIKVEKIDKVSWAFDGLVYSQFRISCGDANKIGKIEITLKLKETELNTLGLAKNDVRLYFSGKELETRLTKTERSYVYYGAVSDGTGEFVIGKAVEEKEEVAEEEEEVIEEEPIVEQPAPMEKSLWGKIVSFFRNLFK